MSEALDYSKSIIETLHHIEDVVVKFALQNYAASGAVLLAYFADQLSIGVAVSGVIGICAVFTWAIGSNIWRYRLLWKMNRIVRNVWLDGQAGLKSPLHADADCRDYLNMTELPKFTFGPLIITNLLPVVAALVIWWRGF